MKLRFPIRALLVILLSAFSVWIVASSANQSSRAQTQKQSQPRVPCNISFPLPRPSDIGTEKFEKILYRFLEKRCYRGWVADREIRNTGPFIGGKSFGTHNAVKIFYSPQVWDWLKVKNRQGEIPDGSIIVKEMFPSPAKQDAQLTSWTVMVKDKKGAYDGWYWSFHGLKNSLDNPEIDYPDSGFGLYCLRCHASAEKESTFITVKNVEGDPVSFFIEAPTMSPLRKKPFRVPRFL